MSPVICEDRWCRPSGRGRSSGRGRAGRPSWTGRGPRCRPARRVRRRRWPRRWRGRSAGRRSRGPWGRARRRRRLLRSLGRAGWWPGRSGGRARRGPRGVSTACPGQREAGCEVEGVGHRAARAAWVVIPNAAPSGSAVNSSTAGVPSPPACSTSPSAMSAGSAGAGGTSAGVAQPAAIGAAGPSVLGRPVRTEHWDTASPARRGRRRTASAGARLSVADHVALLPSSTTTDMSVRRLPTAPTATTGRQVTATVDGLVLTGVVASRGPAVAPPAWPQDRRVLNDWDGGGIGGPYAAAIVRRWTTRACRTQTAAADQPPTAPYRRPAGPPDRSPRREQPRQHRLPAAYSRDHGRTDRIPAASERPDRDGPSPSRCGARPSATSSARSAVRQERTLADVAEDVGRLDAVPLRGRARAQGAQLGDPRRGLRRARPAAGRPDDAGQPHARADPDRPARSALAAWRLSSRGRPSAGRPASRCR